MSVSAEQTELEPATPSLYICVGNNLATGISYYLDIYLLPIKVKYNSVSF